MEIASQARIRGFESRHPLHRMKSNAVPWGGIRAIWARKRAAWPSLGQCRVSHAAFSGVSQNVRYNLLRTDAK